MKYDPAKAKKSMLETYPYLKRFDEFEGDDNKLRFIIYFLDPESEIYEETDLDRRIKWAAKKANLKNPDLDDPQTEAMLCRYFVLINNDIFELWLSKKIAFGDCNHQLRASVIDSKDPIRSMEVKLKVSQGAETLRQDILKLEYDLFKDEAISKIIKQSVETRALHYAEEYAESNTAI